MNRDEGALFGRGLAFPLRTGADGRVAWSVGAENVRQSIRLILLTEPGERVMLPEFGGGLRRFLYEPNTVATRRLIEETVVQALGRFEPRIRLASVSAEADADDPEAALVVIRYELIATRSKDQVQLRVQLAA